MYGKIVDGKLEIVRNKIKTVEGWITNPTEKDLKANGYKEISTTEKQSYDDTTEKLVETYNETNKTIEISYSIVKLSEEETKNINQIKQYQELSKISQEDILKAIIGDKDSIEKINTVLKNISSIKEKIKE